MSPIPRRRLALLALLAPGLLFVSGEILFEANPGALAWDRPLMALLAAVATAPALVVWAALRKANGPAGDIAAALAAVARAERATLDAAAALAQAEARTVTPQTQGRRAVVLAAGFLALLLATGGVVFALVVAPAPAPLIHEHAAFAVFIGDERILYDDPRFDLATRGFLRGHVHVDDGFPGIVHLEGEPGLTLGEFFDRTLDTILADDGIWLDGIAHDGSGHRANATAGLRVLVAHAGENGWRDAPGGPAYVPRDGDRILVTFGDVERDLSAQTSAVPTRFP